ncbi:alpha-1 3-mannosyl-glycoprotein 2-beta-N-acetylglucosaminyltransferase [Biomphalaria pfeifferi]|uniref:Alpha-1,3-mannosyl-glycoprotein 2-beta-N-acetylglucosaminyltransferase n=1 Tax=Biomphalaria pfeifferi TaxID=112525 RepID=A0AAD8BK41_BIOPF|nr:alpha-1 3-mannosyl-glycoprotein 2-beta-N-acetylglucosaminyltransferase [Biomphalaria pfeifferi]
MRKLIKRRFPLTQAIFLVGLAVLILNFMYYRSIARKDLLLTLEEKQRVLEKKLLSLESLVKHQWESDRDLLHRLRLANPLTYLPKGNKDSYLPILVLACNRVSVNIALDKLLQYRPSAEKFPIIVSQDCDHQETADVIKKYIHLHNITFIKQPDLSDIVVPAVHSKLVNYYKVSRHYKWALEQVFMVFNFSAVVIVEDDIEVAPDFYEYFSTLRPLLHNDSNLWCVSAWNDNGMNEKVSDEAALLYRTDFFPGLGWMLERDLWLELRSTWPITFWDDWMRHPDQRKGRQCLRPEISRTKTFGAKGVSNGAFYDKYLQHIKLNTEVVSFSKLDLSYLNKDVYNTSYTQKVYSLPLLSAADIASNQRPEEKAVRVEYKDKPGFVSIAKQFGIMEDFKSGVPRMGYNGIVSFVANARRVFLAPESPWKGYNISWN